MIMRGWFDEKQPCKDCIEIGIGIEIEQPVSAFPLASAAG